MSVVVTDKEVPNASIEDLNSLAKKDQDSVTSLALSIGDKDYTFEDLKKYRVHTKDFEVAFPENGIFGATSGGYQPV
jgi:hypothetical protein